MALSPDVKNNLIDCLKGRPEIHFAILYGSAAEGRPFRDLDIGILVDRATVPPSAELDYAFGFADELERVVPHSVDVRVINDAPLVVNDREVYVRFLERTWDEFLDFQSVAIQYLKEMR